MKLFYYKTLKGNFGDDLNEWLWGRLLPGVWQENDGIMFCGIGTILNDSIPPAKRWIVFGSGAGYRAAPKNFGNQNWNIVSVRGPLTAQVMGLLPDKAVTDGAILLSLLPDYQPTNNHTGGAVVFMPHHRAMLYGRWRDVCRAAGVEFLDPRADSQETLKKIQNARLVLADAMHAAIVADTFRVPWVPLTITSETNSFKWLDWTLSLKLPYQPIVIPYSSWLEYLRSRFLSEIGAGHAFDDKSLEAAIQQYQQLSHKYTHKILSVLRMCVDVLLGGIQWMMKLPGVSTLYEMLDRPQFERAVAGMQAVKQRQGILSEEEVFQERKKEMQLRLLTVKELAKVRHD